MRYTIKVNVIPTDMFCYNCFRVYDTLIICRHEEHWHFLGDKTHATPRRKLHKIQWVEKQAMCRAPGARALGLAQA